MEGGGGGGGGDENKWDEVGCESKLLLMNNSKEATGVLAAHLFTIFFSFFE
jgi:hypothetical protein